jgi:general secretion pathway protein L
MSQDLILRPDAHDALHWSLVDRARGERVAAGRVAPGEAADWPDTSAVERTLVLLPSEDVFLGTIALPARSEREAQQAAPYMIEEALASPLPDTTVMPGARGEDGVRWVMAASKARLADWQAMIEPVAVRPVHVLPDCVAAAERDVALTLFDRGDSILWLYGAQARTPGEPAGGAMDPALFGPVVGPLVEGAGGGPVAVSASLGLAGESFRQVPRGELDLKASTLPADFVAAMPPLLGERWRTTFDWRGLLGPLKRPLALAAALLVGFCALLAGEGVYYRLQAGRFDAASIAEFRAAVPEVTRRVIPAEAERLLEARLAALGGGEASSYLQLMAALAALTDDNDRVRVDHVRFDRARSELSVSALYTDFADFDALNARAGELGLALSDGGARESGSAIQGGFTVRLR